MPKEATTKRGKGKVEKRRTKKGKLVGTTGLLHFLPTMSINASYAPWERLVGLLQLSDVSLASGRTTGYPASSKGSSMQGPESRALPCLLALC